MKFTLLILPFLIFNSTFSMEEDENSAEFRTVSDYSDEYEYNELCKKAIEVYFKKNNNELHHEITKYVKDRIKKAKHSSKQETQDALQKLHDSDFLLTNPKKNKQSKEHEFHQWVHKLVTESIEEAFKQKELEALEHKEKSDKQEKALNASLKKARIAACANVLTALITAAVTASVTIAITYK